MPVLTVPPTVKTPDPLFNQLVFAPAARFALNVWAFAERFSIPPAPRVSVSVPLTTNAPAAASKVSLFAAKL